MGFPDRRIKIITLIENTQGHPECRAEHGLSFYIEMGERRILMDTGASDAFLTNAGKLDVDLGTVDTVVLSHGHYDHGGGLPAFAARYPAARIYMQKSACGSFWHTYPDREDRCIGIRPELADLPQCVLLEGDARIGDGIALFTDIRGRRLWPEGNRELKRRVRGAYEQDTYEQDDFRHEQCLVLEAGSFHVLLSGCAHNGVLNILDRYRGLYGRWPDVLISGFHMKKDVYRGADLADIRKTAQELKETKVLCWTGHCTGQRAFEEMKEILGDQLRAIHTGGVLLDTGDMRL